MEQVTGHCIEVRAIGQGRMRVRVACNIRPAPGQFVSVLPAAAAHPFDLRHPLLPCARHDDGFAFESLPGDPLRPWLQPGNDLDVLGPLGHGVPATGGAGNVLLIANVDPAPLLPFAALARRTGGGVTLLLGRPYPITALPPDLEVHVGHLPRLVADYATWPDDVFVYTTPNRDAALLAALHAARFATANVRLLVTPTMPCGVGACQACAVFTRNGARWACVDGPAFALADLQEVAI